MCATRALHLSTVDATPSDVLHVHHERANLKQMGREQANEGEYVDAQQDAREPSESLQPKVRSLTQRLWHKRHIKPPLGLWPEHVPISKRHEELEELHQLLL